MNFGQRTHVSWLEPRNGIRREIVQPRFRQGVIRTAQNIKPPSKPLSDLPVKVLRLHERPRFDSGGRCLWVAVRCNKYRASLYGVTKRGEIKGVTGVWGLVETGSSAAAFMIFGWGKLVLFGSSST